MIGQVTVYVSETISYSSLSILLFSSDIYLAKPSLYLILFFEVLYATSYCQTVKRTGIASDRAKFLKELYSPSLYSQICQQVACIIEDLEHDKATR